MINYNKLFNLDEMINESSELSSNFKSKEFMHHYRVLDIQADDTAEIIKNSNSPISNDFPTFSLYNEYDRWMYDNDGGEIIVSGSGKIIGYIVIDTNNIPFNLYIFDKYRGYGFGKMLMQYIIDKYDCSTLSVDMTNRIAIDLYTKLGFKVVDICINCNGYRFYIMKRIIKPVTFY